ncbi:E3 ubiquitin-protein ligase RHF2A [Amborella trichopoda]|uniref:RING-type E3 ubiquitin transferase n=1 Tax=Amborella trichopoda TaxID=13333 RepID=W1NDJ8_AMBTC|nr:E3 ubiquitin-protein ligase RHF2A [Amborella trichopoda]XP_011627285.1 E3 ubiquitin-protein ligase RHF2A [Amborella trichopoda]ERM93652.1 hypothetical protein AMTR_s00004p00158820 [Amborella trichopoda]|eukprot:XP_006826415.1 E3 ubiquitin-protein ligase RHF2A [Amborella trichopoda]
MDESNKGESHLTSAAAFVEGGIQEACDDACSICLEAFCDSDPSTVTSCKHEFHLQCILEWSQRSSQCPMCWQAISLKDPSSQELLEAVERERNFRFNQPRNSTIFHLGDFELQHLPVGANDSELEERIIQHLAAAAAMGRAHHFVRREGQRNRPSSQGRPQFLVFSTHPNAPPHGGPVSAIPVERGGENETSPSVNAVNATVPLNSVVEEPSQRITSLPPGQMDHPPLVPVTGTTGGVTTPNRHGVIGNRNSGGQSSPMSQDRAGPSELQSLSETLKSKFNAASSRYKESISKSTKGWRERLFSRNSSVADLGSEVRREVSTGIASVSRMMERLSAGENNQGSGTSGPSVVHSPEGSSGSPPSNRNLEENHSDTFPSGGSAAASCAANSSPN